MPDVLQQPVDALLSKLQAWFEAGVAMVPNFVLALIVVALMGLLGRWLSRWSKRALDEVVDNDALVGLTSTLVRVAVIAVGMFAALSLLDLDKTVTSMLAGLGIIGLALGFAFKDIAANFMSGVLMAARGPFETGDIILVAGHLGTVVDIELRRTILRSFEGLSIIIPNQEIFKTPVVNYTQIDGRRVSIACGVAYGDDLDETERVVLAAFEGFDLHDPAREIEFLYTGFGDSSIDFELRFWLPKTKLSEYLVARSRGIKRVKQAMDAAGLTIPFPIRTLDFGAQVVGGERFDPQPLRSVNG